MPYYNTDQVAMARSTKKKQAGSIPPAGPSSGQSTLRDTVHSSRTPVEAPYPKNTKAYRDWDERRRLRAKYPRNTRKQKKKARKKLGNMYLELFSDTDDDASEDKSSDED